MHTKIVKILDEEKCIYEGSLIHDSDVESLRKMSIPYEKGIDPKDCVGVTYDFQIIRRINKPRSNKKRRYVR